MSKLFASVPVGLVQMVVIDIMGIVVIEANNSGLAFITLTSAYIFCTTSFYVFYRILVKTKE